MSGIAHSSVDVKLKRVDRVYRPGETVQGNVVVSAKDGWSHGGVTVSILGQAKLQLSARSVGLFESMSNLKPQVIFTEDVSVLPSGRVPDGVTTAPFEFKLPSSGLFESYHGVYINVSYYINCVCERGVMKKALNRNIEFIVEVPETPKSEPDPEPFSITPEALENVVESSIPNIPKFNITGRLFHKLCPINLPFTGEVTIQSSEARVRSIELQLVRVETVKVRGPRLTDPRAVHFPAKSRLAASFPKQLELIFRRCSVPSTPRRATPREKPQRSRTFKSVTAISAETWSCHST